MRGPAFFLSGDSFPYNAHLEDDMRERFAPLFAGWTSQSDLPRQPGAKGPPDIAWRVAQLDAILASRPDARTTILFARSSGSRVVTQVAARREVGAAICFNYPFRRPHHVIEPDRFAHLAAIRVPVLIVQGKDDTYGATEITEQYALSQSVHCLFVAGTHELALSPQQWDSLTQTIIDFCDAAVLRRPFSTSRFDEDFYLRSHPDVATALAAGQLTSAEQLYRIWGHKEGRSFRLLPSD